LKILNERETLKELSEIEGWIFNNNTIKKIYRFKTYMDSISFINRLAVQAEKINHHPDMIVGWCEIEILFTSHEQGGVTSNCIKMAKKADSLI
jgi:4a-hydroxytetrahydrobiopterin dehydratase|tara:strand:+ start:24757 stop:25035 length:279 start_codon:yes stop_codon:yes gene_type:complete